MQHEVGHALHDVGADLAVRAGTDKVRPTPKDPNFDRAGNREVALDGGARRSGERRSGIGKVARPGTESFDAAGGHFDRGDAMRPTK